MPRGTYLNDLEKGKILGFYEKNVSFREIGRRLNRSEKVVRNFLKNQDNYGRNKKGGPKCKLSDRNKRMIIRLASNSINSLNDVVKKLNLNVSRSTVNRVLNNAPHIVRQKLKTMPRLLPRHKQARLNFARRNMATDWKKVSAIV